MTNRTNLTIAMAALLVATAGAAFGEEAVPRTYDGAGDAFKEGGKEIGEGFKSLGKGLKGTFTGEAAKEEYKDTKSIGEGFKDVGRGVAGSGRATGEAIVDGVDGDEAPADAD